VDLLPKELHFNIMLQKKQLEFFKKLLNEKQDELLNEATKTVTGMSGMKENMPDPTDRATLESDRNFTLRIRDRERKLIGKIKDALERIENGTYGICESCEEEIGEKRLKARPVTTLCIDCKKRQEDEERLKGI
jgi:DnaK suppressor protein